MSNPTRISNYAIGHLGQTKLITNFDTDKSDVANVCRLWYVQARDEVQRDFIHPFSSECETLSLVETNPNNEWTYSYRYPSNCLMFRRILSGIRHDTHQSRIPYKIGKDSNGRLIFTDQPDAEGEKTAIVTDLSLWPVDVQQALSLLLATYIAPSVVDGGDTNKLGERALRLYLIQKTKAEANAANEEQADQTPESEAIRSRR